jgi:beta-mannosidase
MGGIFWMYDDTWGENGWTIIDYYLRRKISYYKVKRCLAPQRLVLRRGGQAFGGRDGEIVLIGLNEAPQPLTVPIRFGYLSWNGDTDETHQIEATLPARSRQVLATCPVPDGDHLAAGTVVAQPAEHAALQPVAWRTGKFRNLDLPPATVSIASAQAGADDLAVTVVTDNYAHAVHLNTGGDVRLSDHYFDLLPGERRTVVLYGAAALSTDTLAVTCVNARRPRRGMGGMGKMGIMGAMGPHQGKWGP